MVTVEDVRRYLNDLSSEQVSDEVIRTQIKIAETIVEQEKAANVPQQVIENAILAKAGELTYIAYTTEMERSLGVLPPVVASHLQDLRRIADLFLSYVRRGSPALPITAFDLSASIWESITDA